MDYSICIYLMTYPFYVVDRYLNITLNENLYQTNNGLSLTNAIV